MKPVTIDDHGGLDLGVFANAPKMKMHRQRRRYLRSRKRYGVIAGGRRSGKTVEARHRLIYGSKHLGGIHHGCLTPPPEVADPTFAYCAPTRDQAKRIIWEKLKAEIPKWAIRKVSETELSITFITGAKLYVVGMDQPQRIEGIPLDGVVLDELADMKPTAWTSSIRPALSTPGRPPGWALFIGRPRGKNHFWKLVQDARKPDNVADWDVFTPWPSWVVMDPAEVAAARRDLDPRSFRQEYGGEFLDDAGRAYYQFGTWNLRACAYNPQRPLLLGFDFNVSPGVAVVAQDFDVEVDVLACHRCAAPMPAKSGRPCRICGVPQAFEVVTAVIGEVWIEDDSNTRRVCERILELWGGVHHGKVLCYGDPSGGARKTSSERSDWQTIEDYLGRRWGNLEIDLASEDPGPRDRVVVTNSRLKNAADVVRVYVDPAKAPHLVEDLELTQLDDNGDLDEGPERKRTHMCLETGTLVATEHGDIPIEDIRPGMLVWTRKGLRPVTAQWCSGDSEPLYRLRASNGSELSATATHPVYAGCAWIPVHDLTPGLSLFPIDRIERPSISQGGPTVATREVDPGRCASTTLPPRASETPESDACTKRSGRQPTDRSPMGATSITGTETRATTGSRTLSAFLAQSTSGSTSSSESRPACTMGSATSPGSEQPSGMGPTPAALGTPNTESDPGTIASPSPASSAPSAARSSPPSSHIGEGHDSAVERAPLDIESGRESTTSASDARSAAFSSSRTATPSERPAGDVVVASCEPEGRRGQVWDLTVDDAHEFFANGILVSNSDAMAYLLFQRFGSPVTGRRGVSSRAM